MLAHFWEGLAIVLNLATVIHFTLQTVHATLRFKIAKLHSVHFRGLKENFYLFSLVLRISAAQHKLIFSPRWQLRTIILGYKSALKMGLFVDMKTLTRQIEQLEEKI